MGQGTGSLVAQAVLELLFYLKFWDYRCVRYYMYPLSNTFKVCSLILFIKKILRVFLCSGSGMAHTPVYLWWSEHSSQKWVLLHLPGSPGLHTQIVGFGTSILLSSATGSLATVKFSETGSHAVFVSTS